MKVSITFPRDIRRADEAKEEVVESFCLNYGGATVHEARGAWVDKYGDTVYNQVYVIKSYTHQWQTDEAEIGWEVYHLAAEIKEMLAEDTVMYTINNEAYFS